MIAYLPALALGGGLIWLRNKRLRSLGGGGPMPSGPLGTFASKPLPCSNLAAAWLIAARGKVPASNPSDPYSWRKLDKSLWDAVNIVDHSQPWSGTAYLSRLYSSGIVKIDNTTSTNRTALPVGPWYFVQRWRWTTPPKGHAYLVLPLSDGRYRVVQSSESDGYRDTIEKAWTPTGYAAAAVALPGLEAP